MMKRLAIIALLFFFIGPSSYSQKRTLRFERIGVDQGLPQSSVFAITQDTLGFMWFGTQDGLQKYDGYRFISYRNVPGDTTSLGYNRISKILCDSKGRLWVGGLLKGLNRYDPVSETFHRYKVDSLDPSALSDETINETYEDSKGQVWIG